MSQTLLSLVPILIICKYSYESTGFRTKYLSKEGMFVFAPDKKRLKVVFQDYQKFPTGHIRLT